MTEFFDFLKNLETSSPPAISKDSPLVNKAVKDKGFKAAVLACLFLSIVIQILVATRLYDKFRMLDNHFSPYPVVKPVAVDLEVAIPELIETDRNIDRLTQRLDKRLETRRGQSVSGGDIKAEIPSKPVRKKAKPRKSNQVVVVEEVKN
jgi:hypothetical protein